MGGQAQLSDSPVVTVLQGSPPPSSLYRNEWEGSVVMFGGVDHHYYEGEFNWIPLIEAGDWSVHMDRQASLSEGQPK